MSDLNQCNFIGRLGDNPQIRTTQSGDAMATFSIAVSDKYTDKQGNRTEKTEWINVRAFGKLAQIMGQYLTKGSQVFISGSLQTRKYTDAQGIERYVTEIRATSMQMLGSRTDGGQGQAPQQGYQQGNGGQWGNQGYQNAPQAQPKRQYPQGMTASPLTAMQKPPQNTVYQTPNDDTPF
ncbi:single-stranded DNA-binding protein [Moraxella bovoculi]|uniref:single-stranded DNA-binding protein n=1 Tax=Moraxella bovoculi TaxID=386891 RepID=UPI000624A759|nr:single-stranded DNA-binding protein [Moraxella bovoculi]AKG10853.1 hypothetical protein AAX07_01225 [Moraxella bovoculi]